MKSGLVTTRLLALWLTLMVLELVPFSFCFSFSCIHISYCWVFFYLMLDFSICWVTWCGRIWEGKDTFCHSIKCFSNLAFSTPLESSTPACKCVSSIVKWVPSANCKTPPTNLIQTHKDPWIRRRKVIF